MRIWSLLVITNFFAISAWATSFQVVPLDKLLTPADAILLGDYLNSKSVELEDGMIATEAVFKIEKELGLDAEDFGLSEIKVYYPGGKVGDKVVSIEGTPQFISGEKSLLLLTNGPDGRIWVQGLAMGTFKVVRVGKKSLLINSVFPGSPELSQIEITQFMRKVSAVKGENLKEINSDKYVRESEKQRSLQVASKAQGNSRSIASARDNTENRTEPNLMNSFWLVTILGFLGALTTWWGRKKMR
jgi:hypothetical protein